MTDKQTGRMSDEDYAKLLSVESAIAHSALWQCLKAERAEVERLERELAEVRRATESEE